MKPVLSRHEVWRNRRGGAIIAILILSSALFLSLTTVTRIAFLWRGMERGFAARNREAAARIIIYQVSEDYRDIDTP